VDILGKLLAQGGVA